jgi:hypothetical protein
MNNAVTCLLSAPVIISHAVLCGPLRRLPFVYCSFVPDLSLPPLHPSPKTSYDGTNWTTFKSTATRTMASAAAEL